MLNDDIKRMYVEEGLAMETIGATIGVCRETVAKRLRKMEVVIRPSGPPKGTAMGQEHRKRIANSLQGKPKSEAHKQRMSDSRKGVMAGADHPNWNGGIKRRVDGYIAVWKPGHHRADLQGYVMQHILVMEELLDRRVDQDEQVHHINGIKDDNRPENLMAFRDGRDHQMWHQFFSRRNRLAQ